MSLAAQFLQDANSGAPAPAATAAPNAASSDLAAQFLADANAPVATANATPAAGTPSLWDQFGHQLGLTTRDAVTGVTALPAMIGDALNAGVNLGIRGVNKFAGANIPQLQPASAVIQQGEDAVGLPQPQTPTERIVNDSASAVASVVPGLGVARLLSGVANPTAAAIGSRLLAQPGMQMLGAAGSGAAASGAQQLGLGMPYQIGAGILGSALGVGAGSLGTMGVRGLSNAWESATASPMTAEQAAQRATIGVGKAVGDLGPQAGRLFSDTEIDPLTQQVAARLQNNPQADPAAALRAQDFHNLGMQPTLGQITRDPVQFAQEMNLRGAPNLGAPLTQRFNQQNTQLQQNLFGLTGNPASSYEAGSALKAALGNIDDQMRAQVGDAYNAAAASSGVKLNVPLTGVAQDYANVLNDFGDKVPSGVRNNFNALGLMNGAQQKTFTVDDAENLLKVINANQSNDPATNAALGQLRNSVKNALLSADDQGGAYAGARQLAAQRFALHDQVPALQAAYTGNVAPDDFVNRFILNGKTGDVQATADLLKQNAPDVYNEMRNQIGAKLAQGAFGQNPAGDASFSPAGYLKSLSAIGDAKLGAFYSPGEIAQLHTIGRVGGYMNSFPSAAPVNTSNTASAIASIVGPGVKKLPYVGGLIENAQNKAFVNNALAAALARSKTGVAPSVDPGALSAALLRYTPPANRGN